MRGQRTHAFALRHLPAQRAWVLYDLRDAAARVSAVVGIGSAPLWGSMTDRLGPIRVIFFAYSCDAAALVFWALAHTHEEAILAALFIAVFGGAAWDRPARC